MRTDNIKQTAHDLIDQLPDDITWDDVVYEMVMCREIERGLADSKADRVVSVEQMLKEFELDENWQLPGNYGDLLNEAGAKLCLLVNPQLTEPIAAHRFD